MLSGEIFSQVVTKRSPPPAAALSARPRRDVPEKE